MPWTPPPTDDREQAALDEVLVSCLHPTPAARPTAAEVLERLEHLDWSLIDRRRSLDVAVPTDTLPEPAVPPGVARPTGPPDGLDHPGAGETVLRTGRRRPEPPRPPAPSRRRLAPVLLAIGGVAIAAAATGWLLTAGDDHDSGASPPLTTSTTTIITASTVGATAATTSVADMAAIEQVSRPDGLVALDDPTITWPFGPVGECLVQLADRATLDPVECGQPHDLERIATGVLPDEAAGDGHDAATVNATVDDICTAAFTAEVGDGIPDLRIAQTRPSAASWADGDRAYQCLVGIPDVRLVGSSAADRRAP